MEIMGVIIVVVVVVVVYIFHIIGWEREEGEGYAKLEHSELHLV